MSWLQLSIHTSGEQAEALSDVLSDLGSVSVTFQDLADDPIYEPDLNTTPLWQNTKVMALFAANVAMEPVIDHLSQQFGLTPAQWHHDILEDKDWQNQWKIFAQPQSFGRLWVVPTWLDCPDPQAPVVWLDPGLAFGTGSHPTTAMCIDALTRLDLTGKTVIDYGCGSGILGIVAKKCGAERVIGVDIDPQAMVASEQNAQRNEVTLEWVLSSHFDVSAHQGCAHVVVANILAEPLIALSQTIESLLVSDGMLVLSGLLDDQADRVKAAYQRSLHILNQKERWVCLANTEQ